MIPKLIRTASFGHAGMHLPATAGVRAIVTLLDPARTSFASLIYGGCARHTGGGRANRHHWSGPCATCWRDLRHYPPRVTRPKPGAGAVKCQAPGRAGPAVF